MPNKTVTRSSTTKTLSTPRYLFDARDVEIFLCDDARLRADALKNSIVPKLDRLANECIALIREVYDVNVLEDSTVIKRPSFRPNRPQELDTFYESASAGLRGAVQKGKWHGLRRSDGRQAQMAPCTLELTLDGDGLRVYLASAWLTGITPPFYRSIASLLVDNEVLVRGLCDQYFLGPVFFDMADKPIVAPFSRYFDIMLKEKEYFFDFKSFDLACPISRNEVREIQMAFLAAYAIYDSYIQIALGQKPRLSALVDKLNEWQASDNSDDILKTLTRVHGVSKVLDPHSVGPLTVGERARVREAAGQRTTVMNSKRWQVFLRDGFRCVNGHSPADGPDIWLEVDHIIPRSKGGSDDLDNLQTLCNVCNSGKSNRDSSDVAAVAGKKEKSAKPPCMTME